HHSHRHPSGGLRGADGLRGDHAPPRGADHGGLNRAARADARAPSPEPRTPDPEPRTPKPKPLIPSRFAPCDGTESDESRRRRGSAAGPQPPDEEPQLTRRPPPSFRA